MLVVVTQNGINCIETRFLTSTVTYHHSVTLGGSAEHFIIIFLEVSAVVPNLWYAYH